MKLSKKHLHAIHLLILDSRGAPRMGYIAEKVGVTRSTLTTWRNDDAFQQEYLKQLDIYRNNFDDIELADKKKRVEALSELYEVIKVNHNAAPNTLDRNIRLKMAMLEQIRIEMGEGKASEVNHLHKLVGVNTPPRATSYEEWARQNQAMEGRLPAPRELRPPEMLVAEVEYEPANGNGKP